MDKTKTVDENVYFKDMDQSFYLIGLINHFHNGFQTVADALFDEISWKQIFFLNCVTFFKEAPTINDMAEIIGCTHQNANQILSRLEKIGFVEVKRDDRDRRKQRIVLTEKANVFREKYTKPSDDAMRILFKGVKSKDLGTAIKLFEQLENNLEKLRRG